MAQEILVNFTKTYATRANAQKAVDAVLSKNHQASSSDLTYSIWPVETLNGKLRYGVVFYGERAVTAQIHFHFNVVS